MNRASREHEPPSPAAGFILVEVMISVLIFSVGVLALVGLQARMITAQTEAKVRADAGNLAMELIALLHTDASHVSSYSASDCDGYAPCSAWKAKVASYLPNGTATLTPPTSTSGDYTVTLQWQVARGETHRYSTTTRIKTAAATPS